MEIKKQGASLIKRWSAELSLIFFLKHSESYNQEKNSNWHSSSFKLCKIWI